MKIDLPTDPSADGGPSAATPFSFGIEEEYFIVSRETRALGDLSGGMLLKESKRDLGAAVSREMLQSQIEIATPVLTDMRTARAELTRARSVLSRVAKKHGVGIVAAGTYPLGVWKEQRITDRERYRNMQQELQIVINRNVLCGLHVHVAPPVNVSRIDVINRVMPFLPMFLAMSTSSPFWQAHTTGMKGYRLAAYDELPRTGFPPVFRNDGEYKIFIDLLVASGAIPDSSHIWWAIRPSSKFPTVELRIADSCTHIEDALCLAAIFRCLVRCVVRQPELNARIDAMWRHVIDENRWRAQRFGVDGSFIDIEHTRLVEIPQAVEELLETIRIDAQELDCVREVEHARDILKRGTSADQQLAIYKDVRDNGGSRDDALNAVVDWLLANTERDAD